MTIWNGPVARSTAPLSAMAALRVVLVVLGLAALLGPISGCCSCKGKIDPDACPDRFVVIDHPIWEPPPDIPQIPPEPPILSLEVPRPEKDDPESIGVFVAALLEDVEAWTKYGAQLRHDLEAWHAYAAADPDPERLRPVVLDELPEWASDLDHN